MDTIKNYRDGLSKNPDRQDAAGLTTHKVEPRCINLKCIEELKCGALDYRIKQSIAV
jgi:hypothetical protein